jgi:phosphatidylinositol glycan class V
MGALKRLLIVATVVRAAYIALLLVLDAGLADYDTSSHLLSADCSTWWPQRVASAAAAQPGGTRRSAAAPLVVWDAVFFHRIAACDYEYEQFYAFFPGLPILLRVLLWAAGGAGAVTPGRFAALAVAVNATAFLLTVALFYRLSEQVLADRRLAAAATLLLILNPAAPFHAAPYSEALFLAATVTGLWALRCRGSGVAAAAAFAVSTSLRSNGAGGGGLRGFWLTGSSSFPHET